VIKKDRVVRARAQQLQRFFYVTCDVNEIAFEAGREPAMTALVVIQQKNTNWMTFRVYRSQAKLVEQRLPQSHTFQVSSVKQALALLPGHYRVLSGNTQVSQGD